MKVYVFENASQRPEKWFEGFAPGDPLRLAWAARSVAGGGVSDSTICEELFAKLNRDDRPNGKVAPSLSVGDVITIEDAEGVRSYKCASVGWESLVDALVPAAGAEERLERDMREARATGDIVRPPTSNEAVLA